MTGISVTSDQFIVGSRAVLSCTSDSRVTDKIEWLTEEEEVVVSADSVQELQLVFNPVNDSLHGSEFTCMVTISGKISNQTQAIAVDITGEC